jgi:hypothetical protein
MEKKTPMNFDPDKQKCIFENFGEKGKLVIQIYWKILLCLPAICQK